MQLEPQLVVEHLALWAVHYVWEQGAGHVAKGALERQEGVKSGCGQLHVLSQGGSAFKQARRCVWYSVTSQVHGELKWTCLSPQ